MVTREGSDTCEHCAAAEARAVQAEQERDTLKKESDGACLRAYRQMRIWEPNMFGHNAAVSVYEAAFGPERPLEVAASGSQGEGAAQADGRLAVYEPLVPLPDAATPVPRWQEEKNDDALTRTVEPDVPPAPQHAASDPKGF